jgi:hypothetical protein
VKIPGGVGMDGILGAAGVTGLGKVTALRLLPLLEPFPVCADTGLRFTSITLVKAPSPNKEAESFLFMMITSIGCEKN